MIYLLVLTDHRQPRATDPAGSVSDWSSERKPSNRISGPGEAKETADFEMQPAMATNDCAQEAHMADTTNTIGEKWFHLL